MSYSNFSFLNSCFIKTSKRWGCPGAKKKFSGGFTLVEILLAVSLMSMVGIVLYQSILNGLKIWNKSQFIYKEEDLSLFLEKITNDLRNSFVFSGLSFEGFPDRLAFPTIVRVPVDKKLSEGQLDYESQIGKVEYLFDGSEESVFKKTANYSQATQDQYGKKVLLVHPINMVKFTYCVKGPDGLVFVEETQQIPEAVRIQVAYTNSKGLNQEVERLIKIPINYF